MGKEIEGFTMRECCSATLLYSSTSTTGNDILCLRERSKLRKLTTERLGETGIDGEAERDQDGKRDRDRGEAETGRRV